jgi:hypothetical protein
MLSLKFYNYTFSLNLTKKEELRKRLSEINKKLKNELTIFTNISYLRGLIKENCYTEKLSLNT